MTAVALNERPARAPERPTDTVTSAAIAEYRTATSAAAAALEHHFKAVNPTSCYHVPRHRWPTVWAALVERKAPFTTGSPVATEHGRAAPVEVNVREGGAAIVERYGGRLVGGARSDPWAARLRAGALAHLKAASPDDPLEAAFRREAERVRARESGEAP